MKKIFKICADDIDDAIKKLKNAKNNIILTNLLKHKESGHILTELVNVEFIDDKK